MIGHRMSHVARRTMAKLVAGSSDNREVVRAATRRARSALDDEHARVELGRDISAHRDGMFGALSVLGRDRADFVADCAFRLLDAVARGVPVQPIASENAEMFACEEELGRIAVADAYLRLAHIESRLAKLMQQRHDATLEASDRLLRRPDGQMIAGAALNAQLHTLVGPSAQHPDPLIRSQLAFSLVSHYLAILNGKLPPEARTESYFSAQRRVMVRSGVLTGPTYCHRDPRSPGTAFSACGSRPTRARGR
jgi:hypothetical protein